MANAFDPYHKWLGIPPKHQPPDYYRLLGIERFEADADVISLAADQRMQYLRTFQNGERAKLSQQLLNEMATARACLLDETKKIGYDSKLRQKLNEEKGAASHSVETPNDDLAATLKFAVPDSVPEWPPGIGDDNESGNLWSLKRHASTSATNPSSPIVPLTRKTKTRLLITSLLSGLALLLFFGLVITGFRETPEDVAKTAAITNSATSEEPSLKQDAEQTSGDQKQLADRETDRLKKQVMEQRAKEEAERKAKEAKQRVQEEAAEQKAKEEAERNVKEESRRNAKAEAKQIAKADAARRAKQQAERKAYEEQFLRDWFYQNFEQTSIGWAPRIRAGLRENMEELKRSKNKLAVSLKKSQSLLRIRKDVVNSLQKAKQRKSSFKPKPESATSRIQRIKKIEKDLALSQKKIAMNTNSLKREQEKIAKQLPALERNINACRLQNKEDTALVNHPNTNQFTAANGLKIAPAPSPIKFKAEIQKAEKMLKKTIAIQHELENIQ